ncbi:MAG: hypothetical protein AB1689_24935 [Thermodesulfobacteriota bacterium]
MGARSDGPEGFASRMLAALFPLAQALRANRALRLRRPEMDAASPVFRDTDVAHWQAALESSPSLGTVIDQVYEHEAAHCTAVAGKAQRALATAAVVLGILALTVTLPAIGQMFAVSPWFLVAALYAFAALFGAVRAVRLDRFLHVELDALAEPLDEARNARGEAACGLLLLHVRSRRAAAVLHNRVVAQAAGNLADATFASLRNAFIAILLWMVFDVAPAALAY